MATISIASDHAGFALKTVILDHLAARGHTVADLGPACAESCDYPPFANAVCERVLAGESAFGILICGTGIGMSMAANRHQGIRAALCTSEFQARGTRSHNNANVLCLGERVTGPGVALDLVDLFLETPFDGGRHARRIALLDRP